MKIVFVTARIDRDTFSGGIYCILKYAQGLKDRGHDVSVLAYPSSKRPNWIHFDGELLTPKAPKLSFASIKSFLQGVALRIAFYIYPALPETVRRELNTYLFQSAFPEADITVATYWETAIITSKFGKGVVANFMQHYEPYFCDDQVTGGIAQTTHRLGLVKIANSSWLKAKLETSKSEDEKIYQCTNAVDLDRFYVEGNTSSTDKELNLISYGGRGVAWKGFDEMAAAVGMARNKLPDWTINWNVYGSASLPADNDVASYNALGFLNPDSLREAYNKNDVLLSASWYESFPLFPIEAMACGLAVITTAKGTEDYAYDGKNSIVVEEKNVDSISQGIITLATDKALRGRIANAGLETAKDFGWPDAVDRMSRVLTEVCGNHEAR